MHEDYFYYLNCRLRERNKRLFTADQNLNGRRTAINTRQNPNGIRRGYECPEERDYYPYWGPSPWMDIAVMTNNATRCPYYQQESANVKSRWACVLPTSVLIKLLGLGNVEVPNNKEDCDSFRYPANAPNGTAGVWTEFPAHGIPAPDCRESDMSRDNHLGNGLGGYPNTYNWTIPELTAEKCAMRIRYNISTADYDAWESDFLDSTPGLQDPPKAGQPKPEGLNLAPKFGFSSKAVAEARGYKFENNPDVDIFPNLNNKLKLELAINTAQFGRTFEDRSHVFAIRARPDDLKDAGIINLNVRGKRGNIVQVYPAVEFDFVPNTLEIKEGDHVHIQWTGGNTNPHNNDGQGQAGTDRSNIVQQRPRVYPEGNGSWEGIRYGHWGRSFPTSLSEADFLGFSREDLLKIAMLRPGQFGGEMSELDDAGTYFDLGPRKVTRKGVFHYLSTRNNNFSNRSQKGRIAVRETAFSEESIGWNGGNITLPENKAMAMVSRGTLTDLMKMKLEEISKEELEKSDGKPPVGDKFAADVIRLTPLALVAADSDGQVDMRMAVSSEWSSSVSLYRSADPNTGDWSKVDYQMVDGQMAFAVKEGGTYMAVSEAQIGAIVGVAVAVLAILLIIAVSTLIYFRVHPDKWRNLKRSFKGEV